MFACCHCGEDVEVDTVHAICKDCGGFCCSDDCLEEHECDPEGDME